MGGPGGGEIIASMLQAAKRIVDALAGKAVPRVSETHHEFPHTIRDGLGRIQHQDRQRVPEFEHLESGAGAREPVRGRDPSAENGFLDLPLEVQIRALEKEMGIRTDAQRALELSLYMEDKLRDIALISGQTRPEAIFDEGLEGWAGWLDARLFARRNLDREMSVDLMQEIHRRLLIRHEPENAGRIWGPEMPNWTFGNLARQPSRSELAAIEENPLLTYVPGPVDARPYGIVLHPEVDGQSGARELRWLDKPPTEEELAAIRDDPLLGYQGPDKWWVREHGMILYPGFDSEGRAREYYESLCNRYHDAAKQPGFNPCRSAAEFQKEVISGHAWAGDMRGRHSRIAMNFLLEQADKPPSAVADFDDDLLTSSAQWADAVEAGSNRYGQWQQKLEQSGADIDPVDLFDLRPMMQRYQQIGGDPSPFIPGEYHDKEIYGQLHRELRSRNDEPGIQ